jgi:hypothetical protein
MRPTWVFWPSRRKAILRRRLIRGALERPQILLDGATSASKSASETSDQRNSEMTSLRLPSRAMTRMGL